MIEWLSNNAGLTGLLFFFTVFLVVVIWAFRPGARQTIESHKFIPLQSNDLNSSNLKFDSQKSGQFPEDET